MYLCVILAQPVHKFFSITHTIFYVMNDWIVMRSNEDVPTLGGDGDGGVLWGGQVFWPGCCRGVVRVRDSKT